MIIEIKDNNVIVIIYKLFFNVRNCCMLLSIKNKTNIADEPTNPP